MNFEEALSRASLEKKKREKNGEQVFSITLHKKINGDWACRTNGYTIPNTGEKS